MAQQLGAVRFKGKLANVVGYKNSASRKSNNNFARERVYEVSNPKTEAQAIQRAKVRPAQIFYNGFERVLNHAFLPSQRASRNRNRFISHAMKLREVPDVKKGEAFLPFCNYMISEGALGLDDLARAENFKADPGVENLDWSGCVHFANLKVDDSIEFEPTDTIGAISAALIANNPGLVEGMELTFLAVVANAAEPNLRIAQVVSFVLNQSDTITALTDIIGGFLVIKKAADYSLILATETDDYEVLSAGVIISARSGNSYVYTNSQMCKSFRAEEAYSDGEDEVIASYMADSSSRDSDLILQQANNAMANNIVRPASVANTEFEVIEGAGTASGSQAAVVKTNIGSLMVLVLDATGALASYEDGVLTPLTITSGGSTRPLTIADTNLSGNSTITLQKMIEAGFSLTIYQSTTAVVSEITIAGTAINRGSTVVMTDYQSSEVKVVGSNLSTDNVTMNLYGSSAIVVPTASGSTQMIFMVPSDNNGYVLSVNGDIWATFLPEEPRP